MLFLDFTESCILKPVLNYHQTICKNQPSIKADFLSTAKAKLHGIILKWLLNTKYSPLETIFRKHYIDFILKGYLAQKSRTSSVILSWW